MSRSESNSCVKNHVTTRLILIADDLVRVDFSRFFNGHSIDVHLLGDTYASWDGHRLEPNRLWEIADESCLIFSLNYRRYPPASLFKFKGPAWANLHLGNLPGYCGGEPVVRSLINGETELRICLHFFNIESGSLGVIAEGSTPILYDDTGFSLTIRAVKIGMGMIEDNLRTLLRRKGRLLRRIPCGAEIWERDIDDIGIINWNRTAFEIHNHVRALARPFSGAESFIKGSRIKIWESRIANPFTADMPPGSVLDDFGREGIEVATGSGVIRLVDFELQKNTEILRGDRFDDRPVSSSGSESPIPRGRPA